jgi:hypothetical protein
MVSHFVWNGLVWFVYWQRAGLSVVALAVAVAAAVTIPGRTVLFNRTFIPDGWKADGPVPDETVIPFMVALT